jgi:serine/threonine protein kinase
MESVIDAIRSSLSILEVQFMRTCGSPQGPIQSSGVPKLTLRLVSHLTFPLNLADDPEIWPKNRAQYFAAPTDIWSLGLLLAMVLTRALPFNEGDSAYEFRLKCDVPDPAYDLIRSCLRINPAYRPDIKQVREHYWLSDQYIIDLANRPLP